MTPDSVTGVFYLIELELTGGILMNILSVDSLSRRFGKRIVVDNISLNIKKGSIYGLLGPNGAGKTTLINMVTGLLKPDTGSIKIGDFYIEKNPIEAKRLMGLVPQEIGLIEEVSAIDNLDIFASLYGISGSKKNQMIKTALELSGLEDKKKQKIKTYSGGMKRRLNLGVAIMHEPELLILDEPTVGVDAQSRNHIFNFIKEINRNKNTTILYISHYMEEVEHLCKNILIMDLGREVAKGDSEEIKSMIADGNLLVLEILNPDDGIIDYVKTIKGIKNAILVDNELKLEIDKEVFLTSTLISAMEKAGYIIKGYRVDEPTLEEVFLSITGKKLRD